MIILKSIFYIIFFLNLQQMSIKLYGAKNYITAGKRAELVAEILGV